MPESIVVTADDSPVIRPSVSSALYSIAARFAGDISPASMRVDEGALLKRYSALRAWPCDAQLGLVVLAWALGPGFSLGKDKSKREEFGAAVNCLEPDFARAARLVAGRTPTAISLGEIAGAAFRNAALVVQWNLPDRLYWPTDLSKCIGSGILQG